jgi:hypothetical protein
MADHNLFPRHASINSTAPVLGHDDDGNPITDKLAMECHGYDLGGNPLPTKPVRRNKLQALALAAGLTVAVAAPAPAAMCDHPPFGIKYPEMYDVLATLAGPDAVHDMLRNICRTKYMHDAKMRKVLHRIGFSDELIDGNDVSYIAVKTLQALKECMDAHHGDASGC